MKFSCPNCQQDIDASEQLHGSLIDCPGCGQRIVVPVPELLMAEAERLRVAGSLAYWVAAGRVDAATVMRGVRRLGGDPPAPAIEMLESLAGETDASLSGLAAYFRRMLGEEARRIHANRWRDRPTAEARRFTGIALEGVEPWGIGQDPVPEVAATTCLLRDLGFLAGRQEQAPRMFWEVQRRVRTALGLAFRGLHAAILRLSEAGLDQLTRAWAVDLPGRDCVLARLVRERSELHNKWLEQVAGALPDATDMAGLEAGEAPEFLRERFAAAGSRAEQRQWLDLACAWQTPAMVPVLLEMAAEPWSRARVEIHLTSRFGQDDFPTWDAWREWLEGQYREWQSVEQAVGALGQRLGLEMLLILYAQAPDPDPAVLGALVGRVAAAGEPVDLAGLLERWPDYASGPEREALACGPVVPVGSLALHAGQPPPLPVVAPPVLAPPPVVVPAAPAVPPKPSLWEAYVQPFFVENWYIVAGIAMVILGSSLLAYYTWDKHWLVRYTVMPLLLAGFTWSLARVGDWIEHKSRDFTGTAAILRGAAIGLLPINFMAVALLSADDKVPRLALPAMALVYLVAFGWGLRRWCGAVDPALARVVGGTLLGINALVVVGPLARSVGHLEGQSLLLCVGAGFYLGFAALAATIVWFSRRVLTPAMAEEKRVPWFVAGSLAATFLQVFLWVHGYLRHFPQPATYALLVVLTGWLILHAERRALELKASPQLHGGESFLGFGAILLGLLLGFNQPLVRIAVFLVAGAVWLYQGSARRHPLHDWIGLILCGLGGAAVAMLPGFPAAWLPLVGIGVALGFGAGAWYAGKAGAPGLRGACDGMQLVALVLTAVIAPLAQWHYGGAPLATAGWLVLVAGLFSWRAVRDEQVHLLHVTMVLLALSLPYAGFMDVARHTAHHNTMVAGLAILSWLWLGVARMTRHPLVLQARSTVLWLYGALAVAGMVLRVVMGDTGPRAEWLAECLDFGGPIAMTLALIPATYHSRSLGPAGMAVVIAVILFPELRSHLPNSMEWVTSGSGLASACCALALGLLCFVLRQWAFLRDLPDGDRFMGRDLFPFQRRDHTLFTWPVVAAAAFLLVKIDTWNLLRNLAAGPIDLKTAAALVVSGVAWTTGAIYHRQHRAAVVGVHLGWLCLAGGVGFGYWCLMPQPHWAGPFVIMGLLLQCLYAGYRRLQPSRPWVEPLLAIPTRQVLVFGSAVMAVFCPVLLFAGAPLAPMGWLYGFVIAQVVWHGLRTRGRVWGILLFFQCWLGLLALTAPAGLPLWLAMPMALTPTLALLLGIQLVMLGLEAVRERCASVVALVTPAWWLATTFIIVLGLAALGDGIQGPELSVGQQWLLLVTLALAARSLACGVVLWLVLLLGWLMIHRQVLAVVSVDDRMLLLLSPWRLALFGCIASLVPLAGRWLHGRELRLLAGAFALPALRAKADGWWHWPATAIVGVAALHHTMDPVLRECGCQLWAPYLGAGTLALIAWSRRRVGFGLGSGTLLVLGNIHLVRVFAGVFLRDHGLSELHLICLGLGCGLLQASVLRRAVRGSEMVAIINRASLGLSAAVLGLLSVNYFTASDLAGLTPVRLLVSGALAFLAGWYFRRSARQPGPGEAEHADLCEALYHFGVVIAWWCAALLVPVFRQPQLALVALSLPVVYFYVRTELGVAGGAALAVRYRNSATVLGFIVLALYVFEGFLHLVLFPGAPVSTHHYHAHAPLVLLLGLMLLRLHGLGGTSWLAYYGGVALMAGGYFLTTSPSGLSPFAEPMAGAWCALALGHFWILVSYERSPLRTFIQRLACLDDTAWAALRGWWGYFLLATTQIAVLWGLTEFQAKPLMVAPLLAGAASVVIHLGVLRRSAVYLAVAGVQLALALHMDFLIPGGVPQEHIIWVLLAGWLTLGVAYETLAGRLTPKVLGSVEMPLALLVLAHIIYHRPWSPVGLWGLGLGGLLAAWMPTDCVGTAWGRFRGALQASIPVAVVYFSQGAFAEHGLPAGLAAWPVLAATATALAISLTGRVAGALGSNRWQPRMPGRQARAGDLTLGWLESDGVRIYQTTLWLATGVVCALLVANYQVAFGAREFSLFVLLSAGLAVGWAIEARARRTMAGGWLMQLCAAVCLMSIRRQLMLTTGWWNHEFDVWVSLVVSCGIAGVKQTLDVQPRALRTPLLTTLCLMPFLALGWVLVHGLGVDLALIVVGLHSVLFAYLGKDSRESPYHILALAGFVGFVLLTFYSKLQLRAVHAYVIPVGMGVLVLQELFRKRMTPEARNWIRLVTLMAMLGSAGYYALVDPRHAVTFNLTMILMCLLAMGLGSLLRIRLYLALGFAGLMVDLASLLYKMLVAMERNSRMTIVGGLVLVIGGVLIFAAIYYKTNKARIDTWLEHGRRRLGQWQ